MRQLMLLIVAVLLSTVVDAQVRVSLNVNLDRQPVWGPTGYDHVEYYYLPDIDAYYYVPQRRFFYSEDGRWVSAARLPSRYHDFDLYNSYKVVVNDPTPYRHNERYKEQYSTFRGRHDQQAIRDSREAKYFVNKQHPEHSNWVKQQRQNDSHGKSKENGRGDEQDRNHGRDRERR